MHPATVKVEMFIYGVVTQKSTAVTLKFMQAMLIAKRQVVAVISILMQAVDLIVAAI